MGYVAVLVLYVALERAEREEEKKMGHGDNLRAANKRNHEK